MGEDQECSISVAPSLPLAHRKTALYRHFDHEGRLLYVGISLSAVDRLSQHSRAARWAEEICHVTVRWYDNRPDAEAAEVAAITTEYPLHNITHNDAVRLGGATASGYRPVHVPRIATTKEEVAAHIGTSVGFIEKCIREGMPHQQVSERRRQYYIPDVKDWLAQRAAAKLAKRRERAKKEQA